MESLDFLYETLRRDPGNTSALEILIQTWESNGSPENARAHAEELLRIDPTNDIAKRCVAKAARPTAVTATAPPLPARRLPQARRRPPPPNAARTPVGGPADGLGDDDLTTPEGVANAEADLLAGYTALKSKASTLAVEMRAMLHATGPGAGGDPASSSGGGDLADRARRLELASQGKVSAVAGSSGPRPARAVACQVRAVPSSKAQELITDDFEDVVQWALSRNPPLGTDAIRERLVRRKTLLDAVLPRGRAGGGGLSPETMTSAAMTHVERHFLDRQYVNTETMLGDDVADIPSELFFASEDNYAWDMSELVAALKAGSGVMRNPLSRQMFSEADIRRILDHPSGAGHELRPLKMAQDRMKKGVRPATLDQVAKLGAVMKADQSGDIMASRLAIDEFLAYVATLPDGEQETLRSLRVEAKDSLNGQPYDSTIWQAVEDAKGNKTCVHKAGDYLSQAANHLKKL